MRLQTPKPFRGLPQGIYDRTQSWLRKHLFWHSLAHQTYCRLAGKYVSFSWREWTQNHKSLNLTGLSGVNVLKNVDLKPLDLLHRHLDMRQSSSIEDRKWLVNLALEHSRDNPDFKKYSDRRKYDIYQTVKSFCDYHEVPLTTAKNIFGKKRKKKNHRKQITLAQAKKVLGQISQRDRTILFIILQSGMGLGEVLNKFSYMWHSQAKPQLDLGCERMKVEFDERKGNGTWYFTYISKDAIHELRKWLTERQKIVAALIEDGKDVSKALVEGEPIFITNRGKPLWAQLFAHQLKQKTGGNVTSHMFRKLFESEAKVPDRAIDRGIIKFFMGHITDMDDVGGIYDRNPEIREEIFEKEYAKLEPYINLYSSVPVQPLTEEDREWQEVSNMLRTLLSDKEKQEQFLQFIKEKL